MPSASFLVTLLSCGPSGLTGKMSYATTLPDGTEGCSLLMSVVSESDQSYDCPSCRFAFDVRIEVEGGDQSQRCLADLPWFVWDPRPEGDRDGSATMLFYGGGLTFKDYPLRYYEYGYYEHPYSGADAPAYQAVTEYLRSFGNIDFRYDQSWVGGEGEITATLMGSVTIK